MEKGLRRWAAERGYLVSWGPYEVATAARGEIAARLARGELDEELFRSELAALGGEAENREQELPTIVVVIKPRPAHIVAFELDGGRMEAVLPPTYVHYRNMFEEVGRDLAERGLPGARVERLNAPLKTVAARLGLVRYGRNNITYAAGPGSYFQLLGYLTDAKLPWNGDVPPEKALLPECETCGVCELVCPTGAIDQDRMLLHAERCLTFLNENRGPWPAWLADGVHTCLLGCLLCQRCCPANPEMPLEDTGVVFAERETDALLADDGLRGGPAWEEIRAKLERLGQPYSEGVLGRNLRALVGR